MSTFYQCPRGHRWQADASTPTRANDKPPVCPECGTPAGSSAATDPIAGPPTNAQNEVNTLAYGPPRPVAERFSLPGYELLGELGRGGMGIVYKARDSKLKRLVALKMILSGAHAGIDERMRFRSETEAVARLHHVNIVQIYDVGEHDGRPFCALELVEGSSLAKAMADKPFTPQAAAALVQVLARAMQHAHRQGIVHRDLKPANVLLTADGIPKISDFGLAKQLEGGSDQTLTGQILGTPGYMAPEQAVGYANAVGPPADVYALGGILYKMLTDRPPFHAPNNLETIEQVRNQEPVAPRKLQPKLPRDLDTICLKCLEKDAGRRYASADALADDLGRFLANEPIRARRVRALERAAKWARRRPAISGLLAAIVCVSLLGLGGIVWKWQEAEYQHVQADKQRERAEAESRNARARAEAEARAHQEAVLQKNKALQAQSEADQQRRQAQRLALTLSLDKSINRCEQGDAGRGLVFLARDLESAGSMGAADLERVIRINLAAYKPHLHALQELTQHQSAIQTVAIDPAGKRVFSGDRAGIGFLWDAASGEPVAATIKHDQAFRAAAFSPDGRLLATGGKDHKARIWDAVSGLAIGQALVHAEAVHQVLFSPDSKTLVTASGKVGKIAFWQPATGKPLHRQLEHGSDVWALALSPDGKLLVTASIDQKVKLWEVATGKHLRSLLQPGTVRAVIFSADGLSILTASSAFRTKQNEIRMWESASGKLQGTTVLPQRSAFNCMTFGPEGRTVLTATGDFNRLRCEARLWDVSTARPIGQPLLHPDSIHALAISSDGKTLLTGSEDMAVRLWQAARPVAPASTLSLPVASIRALSFSPDGKIAVTVTDSGPGVGQAWLVDVATGKLIGQPLQHQSAIRAVAFSPDGKWVLSGSLDKSARLWDAANGNPVGAVLWHPSPVLAVAFSADGKTMASGSLDRKVRVWTVPACTQLGEPLAHPEPVRAVALSPDGSMVLAGCGSFASLRGDARLWQTGTGKLLGQPLAHFGPVAAVAFSPDGRFFLTAGHDRLVRFWETSSLQPHGQTIACGAAVHALRLSPDGNLLMVRCQKGSAHLWDVEKRRPFGLSHFNDSSERPVDFSADGAIGLTKADDASLRLWDTATRMPLGPTIPGPALHHRLCPQGRTVLTSNGPATGLWPTPPPCPGKAEQIKLWVEVSTGLTVDAQELVRVLDAHAWREHRSRLAQMGGPPLP